MDTVKEVIFDYWTTWAPRFDGGASHVRHRDEWQAVFAAAVPCPPRRKALDLGTGTGACALAFARIGHEVTGLDGAEGMLAEARRAAVAEGLSIDFRRGELEEPPFADASFDLVAARNVFWTLPDPDRALRAIRRVLRPGGVFLFSDGMWRTDDVPPAASTHDMTDYVQLRDRLPFYRGLWIDDARRLLSAHGFGPPAEWQHLFAQHPYAQAASGACPFFVLTAVRRAD